MTLVGVRSRATRNLACWEGVDLEVFRATYGMDVMAEHARGLARPFAAGLLERRGPHLRLTDEGVLLSNEVLQVLV